MEYEGELLLLVSGAIPGSSRSEPVRNGRPDGVVIWEFCISMRFTFCASEEPAYSWIGDKAAASRAGRGNGLFEAFDDVRLRAREVDRGGGDGACESFPFSRRRGLPSNCTSSDFLLPWLEDDRPFCPARGELGSIDR